LVVMAQTSPHDLVLTDQQQLEVHSQGPSASARRARAAHPPHNFNSSRDHQSGNGLGNAPTPRSGGSRGRDVRSPVPPARAASACIRRAPRPQRYVIAGRRGECNVRVGTEPKRYKRLVGVRERNVWAGAATPRGATPPAKPPPPRAATGRATRRLTASPRGVPLPGAVTDGRLR